MDKTVDKTLDELADKSSTIRTTATEPANISNVGVTEPANISNATPTCTIHISPIILKMIHNFPDKQTPQCRFYKITTTKSAVVPGRPMKITLL
uniref:Uncharacterized protein n=1 Tax=Setaria italica TaxID=4555 RepID=K3XR40_SETIT